MNMTRAAEARSQAVSPASTFGTGPPFRAVRARQSMTAPDHRQGDVVTTRTRILARTVAEGLFTADLFRFLEDLRTHNDRAWFGKNKERYLDSVQEPSLEFVRSFAPYLAKISPHFVADDRPVGGSVFRIYRDIRFSKDKSPYKTWIGVDFRHRGDRDVHGPSFYLHL